MTTYSTRETARMVNVTVATVLAYGGDPPDLPSLVRQKRGTGPLPFKVIGRSGSAA